MFVIWNEEGGENGDNGASGADAAALAAQNDATKGTKPSDAEAKLLKEVMEKKEALKEAKQAAEAEAAKAKELAEKLAAFDGIDLGQVKELLKEKAEKEQAELEKRGEWDRLKAQMVESHKTELEAAKAAQSGAVTELTEKLSKREQEITELTIGRSFSESNFIREALTLTPSKARVIYGAHFELKDGKVVAYDKPAGSSERTPLVDGNGDALPFDKAIEKLVDLDSDRDNLLKSKIRAGAGSDNDPTSKVKDKTPELKGLSRISHALANGALPKLNTMK